MSESSTVERAPYSITFTRKNCCWAQVHVRREGVLLMTREIRLVESNVAKTAQTYADLFHDLGEDHDKGVYREQS